VFETTCWLIETGTAPTATAKSRIDAVPLHRAEHVCRGSIPFVAVRVHIESRLEHRPLRRGGFYVFGAALRFWSAAAATVARFIVRAAVHKRRERARNERPANAIKRAFAGG